ncbi:TlpA family protein disulfide reductase [Vaginella massiliensis]|uniref:TlpA family protein disulfide reductase n=1 Tax=Vaginella massiliensis TaxID=1816680 RepID=UPI000838967B|nr:redoxin domain-containing protein [Vaginella massiliensis]
MRLFITLCLLLTVGFTAAQQNNYELPKTIPDFQYLDIHQNKLYSNVDLPRKGNTLIVFYTTECIHCQIAVQHMSENFERFKNTHVVMITTYDKAAIEAFVNNFAPAMKDAKNVTWLQDTNDEFLFTFNPISYPSFYLYDKSRNLLTYKKGSIEFRDVFDYVK